MIPESSEQWTERQTRETERAARRWTEERFGEREPFRHPPPPDPVEQAHREALSIEADRDYRAREIEWIKRFGRGVWCSKAQRFDYQQYPEAHARECDCDQGERELALYPKTDEYRRWEDETLAVWRRWTRATD